VKLYVREAGTDHMLRLMSRAAGNQFAVLALAPVEVHSALRRRERNGDIEGATVRDLLTSFHRHLESRFLRQAVTDAILDAACELVDRHSLAAFDGVQLSGYFALKSSVRSSIPIFVSADRELLRAAEAEAVPVLDPCSV
jgi:uncharacterized protein